MYHHVCPLEKVPNLAMQSSIEGWSYNISPCEFEDQLRYLLKRNFEFISFDDYVDRCRLGSIKWGAVSVTFDDGWADNFLYALPVLKTLKIPVTMFIVSGEISGLSAELRISDDEIRAAASDGVTIGAHTRNHLNLTTLSDDDLKSQTLGCKRDLEAIVGMPVTHFAYPGGRFDHRVVEAVKAAGYQSACSVIGGGNNNQRSVFWLHRDVFSQQTNSFRDQLHLNKHARKLLDVRAQRRVTKILKASM